MTVGRSNYRCHVLPFREPLFRLSPPKSPMPGSCLRREYACTRFIHPQPAFVKPTAGAAATARATHSVSVPTAHYLPNPDPLRSGY